MRVIFRVDDLYLDGSIFELNLLKLFFDNKIPLTLGIIPFTKDGKPVVEKLDDQTIFFLKSGYFEVALHGYKHLRNKDWGEFYGIPYEEQYNWIKKGKSHLEELTGHEITTFIPPWNAADTNTLNAAAELGFKVVSWGHNNKTNHLKHPKIATFPYSVEHLYVLSTIFFKIVRNLLRIIPSHYKSIIVLFHPYNILEWSDTNPYLKGDKSKFVVSFKSLNKLLLNLTNDKSIEYSMLRELNFLVKEKNTIAILFNFIHFILYKRVFKLLS
jgi:peptidoglycan/xylan/chitin deacetylase (PgdA/CDA1 family)